MSDVPEQPTPDPVDLSHFLARLDPRPDAATPLEVTQITRPMVLDRSEDLEAVVVALLMLERVASHNGSRVPIRVLRPLRERAAAPFNQVDVMAMEVEAYKALSWTAGLKLEQGKKKEEGPPRRASKAGDAITYDPSTPPIDLLRRSIDEEFDVEIVYYTQSRGQLNKRRITPTHIEAETYLHAYCHTRHGDRVFRISRIAEVRPVDGRPVVHRKPGGPPDGFRQGELGF